MNKVNPNLPSSPLIKPKLAKQGEAKKKTDLLKEKRESSALARVDSDAIKALDINHSSPVANHDPFAASEAKEKQNDYDKHLKPFYDYFKKNAPELVELLKKAEDSNSITKSTKFLFKIFDHPLVENNKALILSLQKVIKAKQNGTPLTSKDIDNTWQKASASQAEVKKFDETEKDRVQQHKVNNKALVKGIVKAENAKSQVETFLSFVSSQAPELVPDLKKLGSAKSSEENQEILNRIMSNPKLKEKNKLFKYAVIALIEKKAETLKGSDQDIKKQVDRALFLNDLELEKNEMISKFRAKANSMAMENFETMMEIDSYFDNIGTVTSSNNTVDTSSFYKAANNLEESVFQSKNQEIKAQRQKILDSYDKANDWETKVSFGDSEKLKEASDSLEKMLKEATLANTVIGKVLEANNGEVSKEEVSKLTKKALEDIGVKVDDKYMKEVINKTVDKALKPFKGDEIKAKFLNELSKLDEKKAIENYKANLKKLSPEKSDKEINEKVEKTLKVLKHNRSVLLNNLKLAKTKKEREKITRDFYSKLNPFKAKELSNAIKAYYSELIETVEKTSPLKETKSTKQPIASVALGGGAATAAWLSVIEKEKNK